MKKILGRDILLLYPSFSKYFIIYMDATIERFQYTV